MKFRTNAQGLDQISSSTHLKPLNSGITAPRIDSYRFSMANLEDSQDVDLDAILGELCALETVCEREIGHARDSKRHSDAQKISEHESRTHSRSSSEASRLKLDPEDNLMLKGDSGRTESPDNDSAFSDTVSMLSSESSASSGGSGAKPQSLHIQNMHQVLKFFGIMMMPRDSKQEKIRMAMEKIKEANIQKLFLKVFTTDGSAKSLLVDEKMLCSYVTRLLADKNHVQMDPKWAIVEHLPDLYMERFYEDHELLVDNLLLWTRDSKNKIYFRFLLSATDKKDNGDFDEHARNMLLEDFFSSTSLPEVEGPLYLKADSKKGWKKYHFVLRASGLYYFPKDKVKSAKDMVCLATFDNNQFHTTQQCTMVWDGRKKYKAPTDFCFAIKHPRLQEPKSTKYIKYLCAQDQKSLERWMVGMRIAKFGKQLMDNYRSLMDELAQEDLDILAHARSCSASSIAVQSLQSLPSNVTTPTQGYPGSEAGYGTQSESHSAPSELSSGRHSRASSSSSSGCMSDGTPSSCENAFDSEFPMVGETRDEGESTTLLPSSPCILINSGTLTRRHESRRKTSHIKKGNTPNKKNLSEAPLNQWWKKTSGNFHTPIPPSASSLRSPVSPPNMDMPSYG
ncbi:hypothetical protein NQ317_004656 [Molorchus minor]|uniref:Uncharacterized protein n=1 Tax=Molorchus minor TaxID=1323400 RepID=A0ABQ9IZ03_9CUCU|nr:hypothetical protein NQ317_004656 [Molorchus minor]